jgi:hypothetical protein
LRLSTPIAGSIEARSFVTARPISVRLKERLEESPLTVIELPDDLAAALRAKAEAQQLKLEDWFRTLTDVPSRTEGMTGLQPKAGLKLPARALGDLGPLHRCDIYDDAR